MSRRRRLKHTKHLARSTGSPITGWVIRGLALIIVGLVGWWGITAFAATKEKIATLPVNKHPFMVSQSANPVLLVVQQTTPGQLQTLAVARINHRDHTLSVLQLPTNLSDGQTTAAEYLASGYYKELQQMVEQTIALPLNGYIIQTTPGQIDWAKLMVAQPKPGWWETTVAAPWWLAKQPPVKTSLSDWQLAKTLWLIRDAAASQIDIETAPASMFQDQQGLLVADTTQLDPLVGQVLTDPQAAKAGVSVVVKNATTVSGLAALVARYASHLGGEIVAVEPADTSQTTTSLKAEKTSLFSQSMTQLLGVPLTITQPNGRERSDVELIVGVDALARIGKPQQ